MASELSEWLAKEVSRRGWSYREAAAKAGLASPNAIGRIINERHSPTPETLAAIARAFGVTQEYLMYLAGYLDHDPSEEGDPRVTALARYIGEQEPEVRERMIRIVTAILESEGL